MSSHLLFCFTTPYLDATGNNDPRSYSFAHRFATVYGQGFIEWTLSIRRMARPPVRGNIHMQVFSRTYRTGVNHRGAWCLFTLVRCNKDNSQETLAELNVQGEMDGPQNSKFVVQTNNDFTKVLKENLAVMKNSIKMTLSMSLPREAFEAERWASPVPPTPLQRDYTFDCLDNPALLDLKLVCWDGEFQVNKASFWRCAPGLRKAIETTGDVMKLDTSLQTAMTIMTYVVSHTFLAPPEVNRKHLHEVIGWIKACAVAERANLLTAYENYACMQIENLPLDELLELLLTARELRLERLEISVSAVIIRSHFAEMSDKYGRESKPSPLGNKLKAKSPYRGQSLFARLEQMWFEQLGVHVVES